MHQNSQTLREQAETALRKLKLNPSVDAAESHEIAQILEELHIHQIELEIQNDSLQTAYQELDRERNKYRQLYQTMPAGHLTLDVNGVIVEANPQASYLLDRPQSELLGKALNSFFSSSEQNRFYLHLHRLLKQQFSQIDELLMETAAHGQRHLQIISHPILELNPLACHSILVDISDHKRRLLGEALEATSILLTSSLATETMLEQILGQLGRIVPHNLALITLIESDKGHEQLKLRYGYRPESGIVLHQSPMPFYPRLKYILEKQAPALVSDLSEEFAALKAMLSGIKSCVVSPLRVGETPLGFLWLGSHHEQFPLHERFQDIASFSRQVSLALNNDPQYQDAQARLRIQIYE